LRKLLHSETDVCTLLDINPSTLLYAKLPFVKIGRRYIYYYYEDIKQWVESKALNNATVPEELMGPQEEVIVGIDRLALMLNLPYRYVFTRIIKQGKIPYEILNGKYYFKMQDVKTWILSQRGVAKTKKEKVFREVG